MPEEPLSGVEKDRQLLLEARQQGGAETLKAFVKLSGPGWLQSAITLGGGSLSSSLYLGMLAGFALMWLQPLAMILGIIMLSAIAYVTLTTGERPFQAINKHVNPVLGWGWLIATLMANCVWSLPQFSLACGAFRQNLMPGVFGPDAMPTVLAKIILVVAIAALCIFVVYLYDSRGIGYKIFNILLKVMVGVIVLSFFGVVIKMSVAGTVNWGAIFGGLLPDITMLWSPADTFKPYLDAVAEPFRTFWTERIVSNQQDVIVAAAATAVGINMTFLLPYSMLKRGWNKDFRGLAVFDLSTGLFVPFILATGCVVIAAASQFHTRPTPGLLGEKDAAGNAIVPDAKALGGFKKNAVARLTFAAQEEVFAKAGEKGLDALGDDKAAFLSALLKSSDEERTLRITQLKQSADTLAGLKGKERKDAIEKLTATEGEDHTEKRIQALPEADRRVAAMLIKLDNFHLAKALSPLTGDFVAHYVFGIGVVGMAISSIIILMLINGFCICEMADKPLQGWIYRVGCTIPAVGALGPFIWGGAAPYLAIPTSVFGFILIPIAYLTFALLLNQKKLLGDNMPKGNLRIVWNIAMTVTVILVGIGALYMVNKKAGLIGIACVIAFGALAVVVHFARKKREKAAAA